MDGCVCLQVKQGSLFKTYRTSCEFFKFRMSQSLLYLFSQVLEAQHYLKGKPRCLIKTWRKMFEYVALNFSPVSISFSQVLFLTASSLLKLVCYCLFVISIPSSLLIILQRIIQRVEKVGWFGPEQIIIPSDFYLFMCGSCSPESQGK